MQINSQYQDKDGAWSDRHHADNLADAKRIAQDIVGRPGFDCGEVVDEAGEERHSHEQPILKELTCNANRWSGVGCYHSRGSHY